MRAYFLRRLLLIPLTLFGVTLIVFSLTLILPGGPKERAMQAATMASEGQKGGKGIGGASTLSKEQELQLARRFGQGRSFWAGYAEWWGMIPREDGHRDLKLAPAPTPEKLAEETKKFAEAAAKAKEAGEDPPEGRVADGTEAVFISQRLESGKLISVPAIVRLDTTGEQLSLIYRDTKEAPQGWSVRFATEHELGILEGKANQSEKAPPARDPAAPRHLVVYQEKFAGVLQWNFGYSLNYDDPVWQMIKDRLPVSTFYGLLVMFFTYLVCIPLGILKALKHRTWLDSGTSVAVFVGYAIPGFALGTVLLMIFAFRLDWFPSGGFQSDNYRDLSWGKQFLDRIYHAILPLVCLLMPAFAQTTMLMKNTLMDNLAQDYVRTAVAKGCSFKQAIFGHAVRNSLVPIATTFGGNIKLLVFGFLLVEQVFDIPGFGQLSYNALVERDYPIVMASIFLTALLMVIGNIISDILVAVMNPRIRFE